MSYSNSNFSMADTDSTCSSTACHQFSKFHSFVYDDHFGPQEERARIEVHYTQALCMALGNGSDQTKEQSSWLKGFLVTKALPSVLIESVDTLLEQAGELTEDEFQEDCDLLKSTFRHRAALSVVYDMMQGAAVGGFSSPAQLKAITSMAKAFRVCDFDLEEIRYQVALEEQLRRDRLERLFPKCSTLCIDHMLMMPRIETHMYLAHRRRYPVASKN